MSKKFISTLREEAAQLKDEKGKVMSPTRVMKRAGFSTANWYNWLNNKQNPSQQMQDKIMETIKEMKSQALLAPERREDTEAPAFDSPSLENRTFREVIEEKNQAIKKLQDEILDIYNLMDSIS